MSDTENMSVNFDKVLSSPTIPALTKMTVMKLKENQYMTLADFIKGLSSTDLQGLGDQFERMRDNDLILQDVILLAEIVASGEGDSVFNADDLDARMDNLNYFITVVTCESLKRKGLVTIDYSNVTFDPAYREKEFVRAIE